MLTRVGLAVAACFLFVQTAIAQQMAPQQQYPQQQYPQQQYPQQQYPQQQYPQQQYPQQQYPAQQPYTQYPAQPAQQPYAQQPYTQQPAQQPYAQQPYTQQPAQQPGLAPTAEPVVAGAPAAAGTYGRRGSMEAEGGLGLGFPTPSGADFDVLLGAGFHYFVIDGLSVGGALRIGYITGVGGVTVFQFIPGAQYHFTIPGSKIIPYAGAGLGFDYWSGGGSTYCGPYIGCASVSYSDTAFLLDVEGGVKFNLAPHMLIGAGIDIPIALHTGQNMAYLNAIGRFIYAF